jgi:hypothetical protein
MPTQLDTMMAVYYLKEKFQAPDEMYARYTELSFLTSLPPHMAIQENVEKVLTVQQLLTNYRDKSSNSKFLLEEALHRLCNNVIPRENLSEFSLMMVKIHISWHQLMDAFKKVNILVQELEAQRWAPT